MAAGAMSEHNNYDDSKNVRNEEFSKLKLLLNYKVINLTKIFRNSVSISQVSPAGQCLQYNATQSDKERKPTIGAGDCSTVVGNRPTCYIYSQRDVGDYKLYCNIIVKYLHSFSDNISANTRIVILCYFDIEPKPLLNAIKSLSNNKVTGVLSQLLTNIYDYDGGINTFDQEFNPLYSDNINSDKSEVVEKWIDHGGILLTHDCLFSGAESDMVIVVSEDWGARRSSIRSSATRAISELMIITSDSDVIDVTKFYTNFNVKDVRNNVK